jgi:hypothetical protein
MEKEFQNGKTKIAIFELCSFYWVHSKFSPVGSMHQAALKIFARNISINSGQMHWA